MKIKNLLFIAIFLLNACDQRVQHHQQARPNILEYRNYDNSTDTWWYWYFIYANTDTITRTTPSYYYSSSTPVSNIQSVPFSRVTSKAELPENAKEALEKGELLKEEPLNELEEPEIVRNEIQEELNELDLQNNAMTNEGGASPVESESTSSSDTGGDSGGGSDGGGGSD